MLGNEREGPLSQVLEDKIRLPGIRVEEVKILIGNLFIWRNYLDTMLIFMVRPEVPHRHRVIKCI